MASGFSSTAVRRLGYLLDLVQAPVDTTPVQLAAKAMPLHRPALLDPRLPHHGPIDPHWGLVINTDVEPDL